MKSTPSMKLNPVKRFITGKAYFVFRDIPSIQPSFMECFRHLLYSDRNITKVNGASIFIAQPPYRRLIIGRRGYTVDERFNNLRYRDARLIAMHCSIY